MTTWLTYFTNPRLNRETDLPKTSQRTKQIALLTVFTALYIVLRFVPFSILIGGAGGYLSLSDFLVPIYGILLGPYFGGLSILAGSFGAMGLGRPSTFMGFDFLPDLLATVSIGFLMRRKWIIAVILNFTLLALFFANPLTSIFVTIPGTQILIPFAWMHIVAFIILISPLGRKAPKMITEMKNKKIVTLGIATLAFIATMIQHLTGNILFELVFGMIGNPPIIPVGSWPFEWSLAFFAYPIERAILVACSVIVGTPLLILLTKNHFLKPWEK
jgi:hypothetical protein